MKNLYSTSLLLVAIHASAAQQPPEIRPVGVELRASAPGIFGSISGVRFLSNGYLIVNDILERRLLLLDENLQVLHPIVDSASSTSRVFGPQPTGVIAYMGDSTLFVNPTALSLLVIDPAGKIVRVMAPPRAQDVAFLAGGPSGTPAFDASGRLIYRGVAKRQPAPVSSSSDKSTFQFPLEADSAPIVRFDFHTRKLDTLAMYRVAQTRTEMTRLPTGEAGVRMTINPMQTVDDWAVLRDGSIAVIRGGDFHVDWIDSVKMTTPGPKLSYDWHRLSDVERTTFVDSAQNAVDKEVAEIGQRINGKAASSSPSGVGPIGTTPTKNSAPNAPSVRIVDASELPEYRPAFQPGATRVDPQGRLWIRTNDVRGGASIYDVVDPKGLIVDRVQLPPFRVLLGFDRGGNLYTAVKDDSGARLEEFRIR